MTSTAVQLKHCPRCGRTYDQDIQYCLDDGATLGGTSHDTEVDGFSATMHPPAGRQLDSTGLESPTDMQLRAVDDPLSPGAQVGEYVIERKVGEGGMGVIFSATHPIIGKRVAVKVLGTQLAHSKEVVARFVQEAKSVNQIRHRNIIDIFSFGVLADGRQYFAMEFLEGESLAARCKRDAISPEEAVPIWLQVASAIEAAHRKDIVHRDLKPDNIFLCSGGAEPFVKVLDFGIAKLLGDQPAGMNVTSTGMPIGTPTYMSPEQAVGGKVDHRADLYAFGVILFEMIAGRPPFEGKTLVELLNKHMNDAPPRLRELVEVDPALETLIEQLLAKDPDARPPDMARVQESLARLRDRAAAEARPLWVSLGGERRSPAPARPRRGLLYAGVAVCAAIAVGAGAWLGGAGKPKPVEPPPAPPPAVVAPPAPAPPPAPTTGRVVLSTNAAATRVYLDKSATDRAREPVAAGGMHLKVTIPAAQDLVLRVEAEGYKTFTVPIRLEPGDETSMPVVMVPVAPATEPKRPASGKKHVPEAPKPEPAKAPINPNMINPF
jgi:hypothetical protein